MNYKILSICSIFIIGSSLFAQQKNRDLPPRKDTVHIKEKETKVIVKDSTNQAKVSYDKLLKDAVTTKGLITIHRVKGDLYFELPANILGKDLLLVNKISSVPSQINEAGINKGINYENKLLRFYKDNKNKKVWAKTFDPKITVPTNDNIAESVYGNYRESIMEGFDIAAYGPDSTAVIKVNSVFDGNSKSFNNLFDNIGMGSSVKTKLSYIDTAKSFPENIVVKSVFTTSISEGKTTAEKADLTVDATTNIVLLPEPMTGRFSDNRVGYFTVPKLFYNDIQQQVKKREYITKWRLEPKPEDVEKYLRGEVVEPKKKILYYIDPATPQQWQQAIMEGVRDWNEAFQEAGFKNVIDARLPSPEDKDFDPDDVRYSVITYAASSLANAMGPSVVDPRTGEILESDIIWWHNVMSLLQSWMRVQTGIIDPEVRGNMFPPHKMAHAIRFVSSHEVGHTLGLKHNMGSSFAFSVEELRSQEFTSKMGGTAPSIMDYARFNYVAQEGDQVTQITPKIGIYDKFAINYGYRWTGLKSSEAELPIIKKWIEKHAGDPNYFYGEQQNETIDPRSQAEDLGNDAMKAGEYGIINLKKTMPNIIRWTTAPGEEYEDAKSLYNQVINQWYVYNNHVLANIGGVYLTPTVKGDDMKSYTPVPYAIQKSALDFLCRNIIRMPEWLFLPEFANLIKPAKNIPTGLVDQSVYNVFREKQAAILYGLMNDNKLLRILEEEFAAQKNRNAELMTTSELFNTLRKEIFNKTKWGRSLSIPERMTQKNYVDALIIDVGKIYEKTEAKSLHMPMICDYAHENLYDDHLSSERNLELYFDGMKRLSEVGSIKRGELLKVRDILLKSRMSGDRETRNHYEDLIIRLDKALGTKR